MARPRTLTKTQRARICAKFVEGITGKELAAEYECTAQTIRNILKEAGITRADRSKAKDETKAQRAEAVAAYEAIKTGDLGDPLEAANWLFSMAVISARRVALDLDYPGTEADRRKELAALSASAQKLMPIATLRAAKKALEADAKAMKDGGGPEVKRVKRKQKRPSSKPTR